MASIFIKRDKWIVQFIDNAGKKRQKGGFVREKDAKKYAIEVEYKLNNGIFADSGEMTVQAYLDKWIKTYCNSVRQNTKDGYRIYIDKHLSSLGRLKLKSLKTIDIQCFYNEMLETEYRTGKKYSANSVKHAHVVLNMALEKAVAIGLISKNPAQYVELPKISQKEFSTYTGKEINGIAEYLKEGPFYMPFLLSAYYGLRRSEVLALKWDSIGPDYIHVKNSLTANMKGGGLTFGDVKTKTSNRRLPKPPEVEKILSKHKIKQMREKMINKEYYTDEGYVFASPIGAPLSPSAFSRKCKDACKALGIEGKRLHDVRHTVATKMIVENNVDAVTAAAILGHSTPTTTLNVYSHKISDKMKTVLQDANMTDKIRIADKMRTKQK